jgi:hypothetical protein
MTKNTFEGYLFISKGAEHGPEIMRWCGSWDQGKYERANEDSWCDNHFTFGYDEQEGIQYSSNNPLAESICKNLDLQPGKKYRLTIEEIGE